MEKFGIENIKVVLAWSLSFGQELSEDLKDKKIKLFEALGFIDNIVDIPKLVAAIPQIKDEMSELSETEIAELELWVSENYDFQNTTAKELIDAAFDFVNGATKVIAAFKK